ncbi:aspartate aminotransferase family protein, partial [Pseudomonas syringae pv. tagetis]
MNKFEASEVPVASQLKLDAHWMPNTANRNFQRDTRMIVPPHGSYLTDDKARK